MSGIFNSGRWANRQVSLPERLGSVEHRVTTITVCLGSSTHLHRSPSNKKHQQQNKPTYNTTLHFRYRYDVILCYYTPYTFSPSTPTPPPYHQPSNTASITPSHGSPKLFQATRSKTQVPNFIISCAQSRLKHSSFIPSFAIPTPLPKSPQPP